MGRRTREDTTPGKVLALALLANAPIFFGFIVSLIVTGGDPTTARRYAPLVLWTTPLFAILSLGFYVRAPVARKSHRASRIGLTLALIALLLWAFVLASVLTRP